MVNKIDTHYAKIFSSFGSVFEFDFNGNVDALLSFEVLRTVVYNGISDKEYWENVGHTITLIEPNSVFLTGKDDEGNIKIKHIPLKHIHDVEEDEGGIKNIFLVFEQETGEPGARKKTKFFFVYDEKFFYVLTESQAGFTTVMEGEHGAKKCPLAFASADNVDSRFILKKSRLSDSISDLFDYVILKVLYLNYKHFSAFGKEIKAQTRCTWKSEELNVACDGKGTLHPLRREQQFEFPFTSSNCPNCNDKGKNTGVGGEVITIPIEMQGNEAFLGNIGNLFQRIDADTGILTFHSEDLEKLEDKIFNDSMGFGFGEGFRRQAVNQDQVRASYDDIESNLNDYGKFIEQTWSYNIDRAGEMFSESFVKSIIKLGRNHFLKTTEQLYDEYALITKNTSNDALIDKKLTEIILTESRNDDRLLRRNKRIQQVIPFSTFTPEFVNKNLATLNAQQVDLYFNRTQAIAIFDTVNGPIEDWGREMRDEMGFVDEGKVILEIQKLLIEILKQYGLTRESGGEARNQGGDPNPIEEGVSAA